MMKYSTHLEIGVKCCEDYISSSSLWEGRYYYSSRSYLDDTYNATYMLADCNKIFNTINDNLLSIDNLDDLIDIIIIQNKELTIIQKYIFLGQCIYYPLYCSKNKDSLLPKVKQFNNLKFYLELKIL